MPRLRAHAKINLGLKILGRRADGYHELRTIYQTIGLHDRIELHTAPGRGIRLEITGFTGGVADGSTNLAWRAAELAAEAFPLRRQIVINIDKRIPTGAGLGGGSSDAAAVLRALAPRAPLARLLPLARTLGADVALFLVGGTVLGLGRGDEVYPLPDLGRWHCVLAMPRDGNGAASLTPAAFAAWDAAHPFALTPGTDSATLNEFCGYVEQVLPAFRLGRNRDAVSASKVHAGMENDFQTGVFSLSSDFSVIHQNLQRCRPAWVSLTGSGAAQFALFPAAREADACARKLSGAARIWATRFVGRNEYRRNAQLG